MTTYQQYQGPKAKAAIYLGQGSWLGTHSEDEGDIVSVTPYEDEGEYDARCVLCGKRYRVELAVTKLEPVE